MRQQRKVYCENKQETAQSTLGKQLLNKTDPLAATLPTIANGKTIHFSQQLDRSGFLGGGGCMADAMFDLGGRTLVIPFSQLCSYLLPLRAAVMLAALMTSFLMLSGAILRESS